MVIHFKGVKGSGEKNFFYFYSYYRRLEEFIECDEEIKNTIEELEGKLGGWSFRPLIVDLSKKHAANRMSLLKMIQGGFEDKLITNFDNINFDEVAGQRDIVKHYSQNVVEIINTRKRNKKEISNENLKADYTITYNGNKLSLFKEVIKFAKYEDDKFMEEKESIILDEKYYKPRRGITKQRFNTMVENIIASTPNVVVEGDNSTHF